MKRIEEKLKKINIKKIILNVSIDQNENKIIVMKRLNFYIGLHYKVFDILNIEQNMVHYYIWKKIYKKQYLFNFHIIIIVIF